MQQVWYTGYIVVLAFWTGGMALFTFLVTPAIFRSFGRDRAGEIVGRLFPGYFTTNLVLSVLALVLFFLAFRDRDTAFATISVTLLFTALMLNCVHTFLLHPRIIRIKEMVASFEAAPGSPERARFRRLHAVSAAMNLTVFLCGMALLVLALLMRRQGG